jgi:hypothetical protein
MAISAVLVPRVADPAKEGLWGTDIKTLSVVPGRISKVDAYAFVRESQSSDKPVQFLRTPDDNIVTAFLGDPKHLVSRADNCSPETLHPIAPEAPVSSGKYAPGFEAANVFDDRDTTWASERLGPLTKLVSYIGADFGAGQAVEIRGVGVQHTPDTGSSIASALLMAADSRYDWRPAAEIALAKDGTRHVYCVPPSGAHRFWKLVAADNPRFNYAWQVVTLRFYQ